ncbi:MBL fold metallo-hydrolase [Ferrimonas lipolytica]|uniref:beta-lactamase n=1 Tax=Ferrimonas lipolytica TaxID=2724191 RepID=A0A6H1UCA3_9GAMM|nr:MBL fold metallo-hydrolase [Ferrimonas lipolytica]QIZ75993.1 MBL fold metallo-hydrolase [Ferrimonas lipolytica]
MLNKILLLALCFSATVSADRFAEVNITATEVAPGIHMLTGAGGNIGVSSGTDGVLIIDDQFAPLAQRIVEALTPLQPDAAGKPKFIINTHHHGDHTGGNGHFAQHGTVFAHHNVLKHLQQDSKVNPSAYPVVTYNDGITFHFNDQDIEVVHLGVGHTDGDSLVWFKQHNVIHMGDLFFKDTFPFVDQAHGGSVRAYINRVDEVLASVDNNTKIIPGHGELANKADLEQFKTMLNQSITWAESMQKQPKAVWLEQGLPQHLQSWSWRFITEERWIETLWTELNG